MNKTEKLAGVKTGKEKTKWKKKRFYFHRQSCWNTVVYNGTGPQYGHNAVITEFIIPQIAVAFFSYSWGLIVYICR